MTRWRTILPECKRVVMYGAGDQGRVNAHILKELGCEIVALFDDTPGLKSFLPGVPLYRGMAAKDQLAAFEDCGFVVAIGNPHGDIRCSIAKELWLNTSLIPISVVDHSARINSGAMVGTALQAMPEALVPFPASIGHNVILNTRCLVEHDCLLEDGVEIGPMAALAGRVHVGRYSWIGTNATVLPRITIGSNCIIGAGAVVTKDVPDNSVVVGNPARPIRRDGFVPTVIDERIFTMSGLADG